MPKQTKSRLPKTIIGAAAGGYLAAAFALSERYTGELVVSGSWLAGFLASYVLLDFMEEAISGRLRLRIKSAEDVPQGAFRQRFGATLPFLGLLFLLLGAASFFLEKAQQRSMAERHEAEYQTQLKRCAEMKGDPSFLAKLKKQKAETPKADILATVMVEFAEEDARSCGISLSHNAKSLDVSGFGSEMANAAPHVQTVYTGAADQRALCASALQFARAETSGSTVLRAEYFSAMIGWAGLQAPDEMTPSSIAPGHLINCVGNGLDKEHFWLISTILHGRLSPADMKANLFKCAEVLGYLGRKLEARFGTTEGEQVGLMFGRGLGMAVTTLNSMIPEFNVSLSDVLNHMLNKPAPASTASNAVDPMLRRASLETCQWFGYSLEHIAVLAD